VLVIAGTGSNSTAEAVELTGAATAAGADAVLVVAPYYNKPSQEGVFGYFAAVAEATDLPVVLYSIPGRCGIEISVPVVERLLSKYPHVRYIKEAGGSVDRVDQLKHALGKDLTVLSGDDALTLPFMSVGAEGVISVASNLLPKQVVSLVDAALGGDIVKARTIHRRLFPIFKSLFIEPNPVPVKFAMMRAGIIGSDEVRPPLTGMTPSATEALLAALSALGNGRNKR
jgi:4-hydroxy-tetrahydrodipicolinate synthase